METPGDGALSWRPLTPADLPLLTEWLREPRVARWWNHESTAAGVERDFGPSVRGEEPGEDLVVSVYGRPVGLVQRSVIGDYPEDLEEITAIVDVPDGAVELDYLIGDAARRGRGLGPRMIAALVEETWVAYPAAPAVLVAVVAANTASWRALEKAGFARIGEGAMSPDNPIDDPLHYLYRIDRPSAAERTEVVLVVDTANLMGSRPDGWWRDRKAAATRLLTALGRLIGAEVTGPDGADLRITRIVAALEGAARGASAPDGVQIIQADRDGDSTIVAVAEKLSHATLSAPSTAALRSAAVLVVTADRGLRRRLPSAVSTVGPDWLNRLIGR